MSIRRALPLRLLSSSFLVLTASGPMNLLAQPPTRSSLAPELCRDIPYVLNGDARQRLDLLAPPLPAYRTPQRPLIVWIHGGGWESGSWHDCPARGMALRGYAVASIGYRFSSQAKFPAQIEDCKAAIRWLRANGPHYGIDPGRIGVWGASAGGHLAALLGTTAGTREFDVGENLDQSSAVRCVLDCFGPTDFFHWGDPPLPEIRDTPDTAAARLFGGTITSHADLARKASPLYAADKDSAPFLIVHGDRDPVVPLQQSVALDAALRKAGVESTLVVVPGGGHDGAALNDEKYLRQMAAFFDRHLLAPLARER